MGLLWAQMTRSVQAQSPRLVRSLMRGKGRQSRLATTSPWPQLAHDSAPPCRYSLASLDQAVAPRPRYGATPAVGPAPVFTLIRPIRRKMSLLIWPDRAKTPTAERCAPRRPIRASFQCARFASLPPATPPLVF